MSFDTDVSVEKALLNSAPVLSSSKMVVSTSLNRIVANKSHRVIVA